MQHESDKKITLCCLAIVCLALVIKEDDNYRVGGREGGKVLDMLGLTEEAER